MTFYEFFRPELWTKLWNSERMSPRSAKDPVVMAMANPDPEIIPEEAIEAGAKSSRQEGLTTLIRSTMYLGSQASFEAPSTCVLQTSTNPCSLPRRKLLPLWCRHQS